MALPHQPCHREGGLLINRRQLVLGAAAVTALSALPARGQAARVVTDGTGRKVVLPAKVEGRHAHEAFAPVRLVLDADLGLLALLGPERQVGGAVERKVRLSSNLCSN